MGSLVVPELIQTDCTAAKMAEQLSQILEPSSSLAMRDAYLQLTDLLTSGGGAEACLLYTSDAADERSSVDLGGPRIIKKKNKHDT